MGQGGIIMCEVFISNVQQECQHMCPMGWLKVESCSYIVSTTE